MLKSGASSLQISAISAKSYRSSLCLLFFSVCLQWLLCNAFQNKENLFLPIFIVFLGRAAQFTCLLLSFFSCAVLSNGSCCFGAVNYGQSHKKWNWKTCSSNGAPRLSWKGLHGWFGAPLFFYFLWSFTHAKSPRRTCIKFLLGLGAVPLEGYIHVNVSLLFVFAPPLHVHKKKNNNNSNCWVDLLWK